MNKQFLLPIGALLVPSLAFGQVTYGTDAASNDINYNLDIGSGVSTGPVWSGAGSWGMADDDAAGVYYVNDGTPLFSAPYGAGGAAATLLGNVTDTAGASTALTGLAFANGVLYGHKNITPEAIHSVDLVTLEATVLMAYNTTSVDAGGLDADPATGLLYCSNDSSTYSDPAGNAGRGVIAVDVVAMTEVLLYPYPVGETDIDGLAFDPSGSIYLLEDEPAPLHRFDIAAMAYDAAPAMNAVAAGALFSAGTYIGGDGGLGTPYCMTVANSTGVSGELTAAGSAAVADNDVTLNAGSLPLNAFGFFIVSDMSGFVMNPAGSAGNLCLSGDIGRYVGAGQIQTSGMTGSFSLAIDLTAIPTPMGPMGTSAGDTLFFQTWHRDSVMGMATSNFTNGLEITFN